MELSIQLEKPSEITRKLTIKVPATVVATRFERGLVEVQKTAKLKGFRPGHAPMSVIKQYYGDDVRHRVYHNLIDESFRAAVLEHKLRAIGSPKIEAPDHQHGEGDHDHAVHEDKDFTYTATVEIMPEIEVKTYSKLALTKESTEITDADVEKVITSMLDSQSELVPAGGGLVQADGSQSSRPAKKGDFVDMKFSGGIVTDAGVEKKAGMEGARMLEIGSDSLIPGFEDELIGMRSGETKTFRIRFPKDFYEVEFQDKDAEFTVTINEVKEKKLPTLDDDFAKQGGYESVADLRAKAREFVTREKTEESDRKLRSELLQQLIEKNPFDVPNALIEAESRAVAQDFAQRLKQQGANDEMIQQAIMSELGSIKQRAENQVRSSLILESIAKKEKIETTDADFENEVKNAALAMKVEEEKIRDFYAKDPGRKEDMLFRLRQDRTLKFLLDSAKIKNKS